MDVKSGVKAATLNVGNKNYELPLYEGTTGPEVVDMTSNSILMASNSVALDASLPGRPTVCYFDSILRFV